MPAYDISNLPRVITEFEVDKLNYRIVAVHDSVYIVEQTINKLDALGINTWESVDLPMHLFKQKYCDLLLEHERILCVLKNKRMQVLRLLTQLEKDTEIISELKKESNNDKS